MSWIPFRKKKDEQEPGAAPEPPAQAQGEPVDDDRTDPLVESGGIEERVTPIQRDGDKAVYEIVELHSEAGLADRFLRIHIHEDGPLAQSLSELWLNQPEQLTGFHDLLVSDAEALSAKFAYPDFTLAALLEQVAGGTAAFRPRHLLWAVADCAALLADACSGFGLVWSGPTALNLGFNRRAGRCLGLDGYPAQFLAWDELAPGEETPAAQALASLLLAGLAAFHQRAREAGLDFQARALGGLILRLEQLPEQPGLSYSALASRISSIRPACEMTGATDTGVRREHNEDAYLLLELDQASSCGAKLTLAAVADGMGGHASGEIASSLALSLLRQQLTASLLGPSTKPVNVAALSDQLQAVIPSIDRVLTERASMDIQLQGMGTTLAGIAIASQVSTLGGEPQQIAAQVFHVGDSRAYLVTPAGLFALTRDHSYVQGLLDAGGITPEEARTHKMKNVITHCLGGGSGEGSPDVSAFMPGPGDVILVCSDGLSDAIDDAEIWQVITESGAAGLEGIAKALINAANAAGGPDNITVVLVGCGAD